MTRKQARALSQARRIAAAMPGVSGVDLGYVYRDGQRTAQVGLRFHVERKVPAHAVPPGELLRGTSWGSSAMWSRRSTSRMRRARGDGSTRSVPASALATSLTRTPERWRPSCATD